jgi:hypothetical protein
VEVSHSPAALRGGELARAARRARGALPGPDSAWWLVALGAAFTAAELLSVSPWMGLSWDEVVYVSQVSGNGPAAWLIRRAPGAFRCWSRRSPR